MSEYTYWHTARVVRILGLAGSILGVVTGVAFIKRRIERWLARVVRATERTEYELKPNNGHSVRDQILGELRSVRYLVTSHIGDDTRHSDRREDGA